MHKDHQTFLAALKSKNKVKLTFYSKEDHQNILRTCAPMDFAPSRRTKNKSDRYHFWDYDSDTTSHTLSLLPDQVIEMKLLSEKFEPSEFVSWDTSISKWSVDRDWGEYS